MPRICYQVWLGTIKCAWMWGGRHVTQPAGCQPAIYCHMTLNKAPQTKEWDVDSESHKPGFGMWVPHILCDLRKINNLSEFPFPHLSKEISKSSSSRELSMPVMVLGVPHLHTVPQGQMDGGNSETTAEDNSESSGNGLSPHPLSFVFLIYLLSFQKFTLPPTTEARDMFHGECSTSNLVFWADFTPTCLSILTPPDWAPLFHCRIMGFSHKVFTGYVKYNQSFMNMN